jgi:predicted alpha/beta-fold hydrolase
MPAPAPPQETPEIAEEAAVGAALIRDPHAGVSRAVVAARRPRADDLAGKLARHAPDPAPPPPRWRRERWATPDADFIDVDFQDAPAGAPLLVLFHGLEGSSASHYAQAFAHWAAAAGWRFAVPHFRGCSGELNLAPRAYHSGDFEEIGWILGRLRAHTPGRCRRWASRWAAMRCCAGPRRPATAPAATVASAVAAVCSPIDLAAGGHAIGRGFNRQVYTRMFLRTMKPKALAKLAQHPGLFSREAAGRARPVRVRQRVHRAAARLSRHRRLLGARLGQAAPGRIRIPALVLNALQRPLRARRQPARAGEVGRFVTLWQPPHGGHVGFPQGRFPGHVHPARAVARLAAPTAG